LAVQLLQHGEGNTLGVSLLLSHWLKNWRNSTHPKNRENNLFLRASSLAVTGQK